METLGSEEMRTEKGKKKKKSIFFFAVHKVIRNCITTNTTTSQNKNKNFLNHKVISKDDQADNMSSFSKLL